MMFYTIYFSQITDCEAVGHLKGSWHVQIVAQLASTFKSKSGAFGAAAYSSV